jgi:TonB family protein
LKEISSLLNPGSAPHREIPMALPVAEAVAAAEPEKKSLASQHVSLAPHTLLGAAAARTANAKPAPRKTRVALPLFIVIVVLTGILLAPRMLNRYSQLQPHADTVQPTIAPASETLTPPPGKSPSLKPGASKPKAEDITATKATRAKELDSALDSRAADTDSGLIKEKPPAAKVGSAPPKATASKTGRGTVQYQVVPEISQRAKDTIQGTVRVFVKLRVDANGNVSDAELTSGSNRFFGDQAVDVSRRWTFTPPQVDGQNAPSEWLLRYEFSRGTTKVFPTQTNP